MSGRGALWKKGATIRSRSYLIDMPAPDESDPTNASQSGNINANVSGDMTVGGDVAGRDKVVTTTTTAGGDIVSGNKTQTFIQSVQAVIPLPSPILIGAAVILALGPVLAAIILVLSPRLPLPTSTAASPVLTPGSTTSPTPTVSSTAPPTPTALPTFVATPVRINRSEHPELSCLSEKDVRVVAYDAARETVWAASDLGLLRIDHSAPQWKWDCPPLPDGFGIQALAIAPDGEVWLGGSQGVLRLDGQGNRTYTVDEGLLTNEVTALAVRPNGGVWAGHYDVISAGVSWFDPDTNRWQALRDNDASEPFNRVYALAVHPTQDRVWVATGKGLRQVDTDGNWTVIRVEDSPPPPIPWLPDNAVSALMRAEDGCVWVGTGGGTAILGDGGTCMVEEHQWLLISPPGPGIGWEAPSAIVLDGRGNVWLATRNGVWPATLNSGTPLSASKLVPGEDLKAEFIHALANDEGGDHHWLWIGTDTGLYYWPLPQIGR